MPLRRPNGTTRLLFSCCTRPCLLLRPSDLHVLLIVAGGGKALVGIATFDSAVHFYALRTGAAGPHMLVVSDVDEPYAPLSMPLLAPVSECRCAERLCQLKAMIVSVH